MSENFSSGTKNPILITTKTRQTNDGQEAIRKAHLSFSSGELKRLAPPIYICLCTFLVVENEEILEGTASVSITSNPRKEDVETTGPTYLIKSNKSNNVIPTRMVNTGTCIL